MTSSLSERPHEYHSIAHDLDLASQPVDAVSHRQLEIARINHEHRATTPGSRRERPRHPKP